MAESVLKSVTYADLEAVSPFLVAEIINGALVTHPRPSPRHSIAANVLGSEITNGFQFGRGGPGGWIFMSEPELHLGANVVVPDISGWRRERLQSLPGTAFIETPPDWVCEIISPSTETYDRGPKRQMYASAGVAHLWLVNPVEQYLEAFQLVAGQWLLQSTVSGAEEVKIPPFDAVAFSLGLLWPFDKPVDASNPKT